MKIHTRTCFLTLLMLLGACAAVAQKTNLSLHGTWSVRLDADSVGVAGRFFEQLSDQSISIPGTLDQAGLGTSTVGPHYGILSRRHTHIGPAWYNRYIDIPKDWENCSIDLFMERVMWQSQVWIDGKSIGVQDGLGTPHLHKLGTLKLGRHLLSIRVNNDMIHNIGDKGHSYGEYTQIIWNGMIGAVELRPMAAIDIEKLTIWPQAKQKQVRMAFDIKNSKQHAATTLHYTIKEYPSGKIIKQSSQRLAINETITHHQTSITISDSIKLWSDNSPNLYTAEVTIGNGKLASTLSSTFGFREITTSRSKILVNGTPTFMRGNLDCLHFPLTGYPSCDTKEWERIFRIYKEHGLNHVRFHSWCPPKAAFDAADRLGIYIQAEVLWIDWWMSVINKDRPEMTTRGLPLGLGHNPSADTFAQAEMERMVEAYGNHPSFALMCIGNELGNSDFDKMQPWIEKLKTSDNRRLYSISTARRIMPVDQYMVTHNIPNVGGTYGLKGGGTDFDLEHNYSKASIPIIAHELGQYPIHPRWSEIDKYKGVLEARNLIDLKKLAEKNQLLGMDSIFHQASGALQTLLYKALLENLYRTPSCAGFSMLSMTDYSGQGEALVGWLDSFWDSKGVVAPSTFHNYSNSVVLLARFPKYRWQSGEHFTAKLQVANYGSENIQETLDWSLTNSKKEVVAHGNINNDAKQGAVNELGTIEFKLPLVSQSEQLTLKLNYPNAQIENQWTIWLFANTDIDQGKVLVTDRFDQAAENKLKQGGKVLLLAHRLGAAANITPLYFTPLFWSNSFFPGQSNKTLGLYIQNQHPALALFPTNNHTDWQWQTLCSGRAFELNAHPALRPIVQPISDFHISDRLGSIFECRVGQGKLLVSGHDLSGDEIEIKTLKNSLLNYVNSDAFAPNYPMVLDSLRTMFYTMPTAHSVLPKGFEQAVLYVDCGALSIQSGETSWSPELDQIRAQEKGCTYNVVGDNTWRDELGTAWTGREMSIVIDTPNGLLCDLYVKFEDWNNQQREGVVSIEGRESVVESIDPKGTWIKLFVMREDTNDGKITLKVRTTKGGNMMIGQIALVKVQ